jgi:hypothetical protein
MLTLAAADTLAAGASVATQVAATVFGMELNGTTEVYKVLDQRQLASSPATIYTAPGSTTAFVKTIMVNNNDTVSRTFRFFRGGTAAANALTPAFSLLPGGCAVYEDGIGWSFYNSAGQLLNATGLSPNGANELWGPTGVLAESIARINCPETNQAAPTASGTLFMQAIYLQSGMTVSNILWHSATTAAGTPTNYFLGLYDINRNLLATSANQTTTAWAAQTMKTLAMTTPYLVQSSGLYYIGMFMTATTVITSKGSVSKTNGSLHAQAPILSGISTTGLTTALPNPAAAITAGLLPIWCAVS